MATGALSTALKPNVSGGEEADIAYQKALAELTSALDSRKNRLFDPELLAIAAGFGTPAATFGESIGNVGKTYGEYARQQQKEDIDTANMRLQIAQAQREQASRLAGQKAFQGLLGGRGAEVAPTAGGAPGGEGAPAQPPVRDVSVRDALAFASAFPEQKEFAKLLMDAAKQGSERFKIAMNGTVFDTQTGKYVTGAIPGQTPSKFMIPEVGAEVQMLPWQYDEYQTARRAGYGKEWINDFMSATPVKGGFKAPEQGAAPAGAPTVAGAPTAGGKTVPEIESQAAGARAREEARAKAEIEREQATINAGAEATGNLATYGSLRNIVKKPGAENIFGIFNRPDFKANLGKLLESGVGVTGFTIGVPEIQTIMRNIGLPQEQINDYQLAASLMAQVQMQTSRLQKGQGSVSDFERRLYGQAAMTTEDNPQTILKKIDMLSERAKFDREASKLLRKSKMSVDDFKDTDEYKNLVNNYLQNLERIVNPPKPGQSKPSSTSQELAERRRRLLEGAR